ncbi:MAG TPA: hypothetical protein IAA18_00600 [Candidatus Pseudomonas excrementavium]|nr:hypothetical protein [Candidatus Pseudomonas excrementavium]
MATLYRRADMGSPSYSYSTSTTNQNHFNAIKAVLKACLVSGYGTKPAAGWSLIAEGARHIVLSNGPGTMFVCLNWASSNNLEVWLSCTFTGMNGDVMTGAGLKSGTRGDNNPPHKVCISLIAYSSDTSGWSVIADERTFILSAGGNILSNGVFGSFSTNLMCLYVGEDSNGNGIAVGGRNTVSDTVYSNFDSNGFTSLKDPNTGLLVGSGDLVVGTPGLSIPGRADVMAPIFQLAQVRLVPAIWCAGNAEVLGRLRGVALIAELAFYERESAARCLGRIEELEAFNIGESLPLDDGHAYFVMLSNYDSATAILTDNPEFW